MNYARLSKIFMARVTTFFRTFKIILEMSVAFVYVMALYFFLLFYATRNQIQFDNLTPKGINDDFIDNFGLNLWYLPPNGKDALAGRLVYTIYLAAGEYMPEPWASIGGDFNNIFFFGIFFLMSFSLNVVLMNLLIAYMGEQQGEDINHADEIEYRSKLEFICANYYIIQEFIDKDPESRHVNYLVIV